MEEKTESHNTTAEMTDEIPRLGMTKKSLKHLKSTSKWLNFFAILSYIGMFFLIITAIAALFRQDDKMIDATMFARIFSCICYLVIAAVYYFLGRFLFRSSTYYNEAAILDTNESFEDANKYKLLFWKYYGILTIISLASILLLIILLLLVIPGL